MAVRTRLDKIPSGDYVNGFLTPQENEEAFKAIEEIFTNKKKRILWGITGYGGPSLVVFGACGKNPEQVRLSTPAPLRNLLDKVASLWDMGEGNENPTEYLPFQVSVNLYKDAQKALISHKDGVGKRVGILTLGAHTVLTFGHYPSCPAFHTRIFPNMFGIFEKVAKEEKETKENGKEEKIENGQEEGEKKKSIMEEKEEEFEDPALRKPTSPLIPVWTEPGSLLLLQGESFFDYAHGIVPSSSDTYHPNVYANDSALLSLNDGDVVKRGPRISIVFWSG